MSSCQASRFHGIIGYSTRKFGYKIYALTIKFKHSYERFGSISGLHVMVLRVWISFVAVQKLCIYTVYVFTNV